MDVDALEDHSALEFPVFGTFTSVFYEAPGVDPAEVDGMATL